MKNHIVSCALCVVLMCPAYGSAAGGAKAFRVGVLYWSMNIAGQVAMRKGLEDELARINAAAERNGNPTVVLETRVAGDGAEGIENQIKQMEDFITTGIDLLIVQPTDNAALASALRQANSAKIPVIAYDQYIDGGTLTAYRTSDNYQAGYLDGEYISSRFPAEKELQIVMVEYPHVSSTVERVNGFIDALSKSNRKYRILKTYEAVEPVAGKKAGEGILHDFPDKGSIDVVFTVNDGGGLAVVDTLASAGRNEIQVATIDGDPRSIDNIKAGRLTVIDSAQYCGPLGAEAMKAAYSVIMGKKPPFYALVPVFPITSETLRRYSGWSGPISDDFIKPWKSVSPEWHGSLKVVRE
jgi:ribose transport system substrate-binding protein